MRIFSSFEAARKWWGAQFKDSSQEVKAAKWQGMEVHQKPDMAMRELLNISFQVPMSHPDLHALVLDVEPNLPWADVHFDERVGGEPLNPGESWKIWPWGHSADKFRVHDGQYDHTYMERFWPRYAGITEGGRLRSDGIDQENLAPNRGIRFAYGDLDDLIKHLEHDPWSRQAYLPIWFPEDGKCNGRRPCTLGYHFILRNGYFHHTYYIRSCDFVRHWADDCYLAVRLHWWILDRLREFDPFWKEVKPGLFTMHIVSLHMFVNDWIHRYGEKTSSV